MFAIRHATAEDADRIAAVHVGSWRSAYAGMIPAEVIGALDENARASFWSRHIGDDGWPVFVAEGHREIVGFASCIPCRDPDLAGASVCELATIYLVERVGRRGIGTSLLERCVGDATHRGFDAMTLWVLEANVRARAFYASRGFRLDGTRKHDARLEADEVRMRAALPLAHARWG